MSVKMLHVGNFHLTIVHTPKKKNFFFSSLSSSPPLQTLIERKKIFCSATSKTIQVILFSFSLRLFLLLPLFLILFWRAKKNNCQYVFLFIPLTISYGHIIPKAPDPVRSPQLNGIQISQYYGGGPHGNTGCCSFCIFYLQIYFFYFLLRLLFVFF